MTTGVIIGAICFLMNGLCCVTVPSVRSFEFWFHYWLVVIGLWFMMLSWRTT